MVPHSLLCVESNPSTLILIHQTWHSSRTPLTSLYKIHQDCPSVQLTKVHFVVDSSWVCFLSCFFFKWSKWETFCNRNQWSKSFLYWGCKNSFRFRILIFWDFIEILLKKNVIFKTIVGRIIWLNVLCGRHGSPFFVVCRIQPIHSHSDTPDLTHFQNSFNFVFFFKGHKLHGRKHFTHYRLWGYSWILLLIKFMYLPWVPR
jgi:hypothetical protein